MQKPPLISIVITYYSYADYLLEAVDSIKAQTYSNFEVIIVDDGSPEKHVFKIDFGTLNFPLKVVTHETNKGLPEARNTGVKHASGDFLVILDSDDLIEPTFLEETMAALVASGKNGIYTETANVQLPRLSVERRAFSCLAFGRRTRTCHLSDATKGYSRKWAVTTSI